MTHRVRQADRPSQEKLTTGTGRLGEYTDCHREPTPIKNEPVWISATYI